jgi:hypothetical protein
MKIVQKGTHGKPIGLLVGLLQTLSLQQASFIMQTGICAIELMAAANDVGCLSIDRRLRSYTFV